MIYNISRYYLATSYKTNLLLLCFMAAGNRLIFYMERRSEKKGCLKIKNREPW